MNERDKEKIKEHERFKSQILFALHDFMITHPDFKQEYFRILEEKQAAALQSDADFFLHTKFPFGFDALSVDDEEGDDNDGQDDD